MVDKKYDKYFLSYDGSEPKANDLSSLNSLPPFPEIASPQVDRFVKFLEIRGIPTKQGEFGAHMLVEIHNDGPVTIWLEK